MTWAERRTCERIRNAAGLLVVQAIGRGDIQRQEFCAQCGDGDRRVIAHHEDYRRPFDVIWLCFTCHAKRHQEIDLNPQIMRIAEALGVFAENRLPYGYIPRALRKIAEKNAKAPAVGRRGRATTEEQAR